MRSFDAFDFTYSPLCINPQDYNYFCIINPSYITYLPNLSYPASINNDFGPSDVLAFPINITPRPSKGLDSFAKLFRYTGEGLISTVIKDTTFIFGRGMFLLPLKNELKILMISTRAMIREGITLDTPYYGNIVFVDRCIIGDKRFSYIVNKILPLINVPIVIGESDIKFYKTVPCEELNLDVINTYLLRNIDSLIYSICLNG